MNACETKHAARMLLLKLRSSAHLVKVIDEEGTMWRGEKLSMVIRLAFVRDKTKKELKAERKLLKNKFKTAKKPVEDDDVSIEDDDVSIDMDGEPVETEERVDDMPEEFIGIPQGKRLVNKAAGRKVDHINTGKRKKGDTLLDTTKIGQFVLAENTIILKDDHGPGAHSRIMYWANRTGHSGYGRNIFILTPHEDYDFDKFVTEEDLSTIVIKVSELPDPPPPPKVYRPPVPAILRYTSKGKRGWTESTIEDDGTERFVYFYMNAFEITGGVGPEVFKQLDHLKEWLEASGDKEDVNKYLRLKISDLMGVRKKAQKRIAKRTNWVTLEDHVRTIVEGKQAMIQRLGKADLWSRLSVENADLVRHFNGDNRLSDRSPVKQLAAILHELRNEAESVAIRRFRKLIEMIPVKPPKFEDIETKAKKLDALITAKYPLIQWMNSNHLNKQAQAELIHYMNVMDRTHVRRQEVEPAVAG